MTDGDFAWIEDVDGTEIVSRADGRVRLATTDEVDLARVARLAAGAGQVTQFSLEPPSLSEVFRTAVGR